MKDKMFGPDHRYHFRFAALLLFLLGGALLAGLQPAHAQPAADTGPANLLKAQVPLTGTPTPGCAPGWVIVPSPDGGPYNNHIYEIEAIAPDDIWAVGYHGPLANYQTLTMHWNGTEWSVVSSPNRGTTNYLFSVSAAASNDVWAVGASNTGSGTVTVAMHWDGTQWSLVSTPNPGASASQLLGVDVLSPTDAWAVGVGSVGEDMLILHWDGATWSVVPSGTPGLLTSVEALSPTDAWAVGHQYSNSGDEMRIMHWDGSAWTRVMQPTAGTASRLTDVFALAPNDIWAVGTYGEGTNVYRTLTIHWDGSAWQLVPSPTIGIFENILHSVVMSASNDVWAVGSYYDSFRGTQPLTLHWDGASWTGVSNPTLPTNGALMGVDIAASSVWAGGVQTASGGGSTRTLVERYSAECTTPQPTFTTISTPTNTPWPTSTPTRTPTPTDTATPIPPTFTATPVCGLRWREFPGVDVGTTGSRLFTVSARAPNDIWAVGVSNTEGGGYRTLIEHWDGTAWAIVPSPNPGNYNYLAGVAAIAANNAWAAGYTCDNTTCRTLLMRWNGSAWSTVSSPNVSGVRNYLNDIVAVSSSDIWAVGYTFPTGGGLGQTLILRWNGSAWSIVPSPNQAGQSNYLNTVDAVSSGDVWVGGYYDNGQLSPSRTLMMRWNGSAWSIVPSPNVTGAYYNVINGLGVVSANSVWAVGYSENLNTERASPLTLHWDGAQWVEVPGASLDVEGHYLNDISVLDASNVWAVGYTSDYGIEAPVVHYWNGSAWTVQARPRRGHDAGLGGVVALSPTDAWAVGYKQYWDGTGYYDRVVVERFSDPCGNGTITPTPAVSSTPAPCVPNSYSDVPPGSTFHTFVSCLSVRGIVSGYSDCTFRPNNSVTRGQLAKMVSNSAGFSEPVSGQTFQDVPPSHTFYEWIERLVSRGYMTGYPCAPDSLEPCIAPNNRPYFRPQANATRGQTSKIVANAAGFSEPVSGQTFQDVPTNHTFYEFIQRLANRNVMSGYNCGGVGEPCVGGRPYFRPGNDVTRGQSAKIVANAFFSECGTP